ncbi:hypothetical protein [Fibrella aquatilis]|uniref:Uncharacterized protein n=1 Tax=Fibrella aquatilis TaxID=2817059 RepID=A0A939G6V5_9BACT|nr:hypothetical protein [Fibrella aquatilis]MBO0931470.1 hypothetical protein [Fibrella aquatilis]
MKTLLSAVAIVLLLTQCSSLMSRTTVPPGKEFELGSKNGFTARVENVGTVPVTVSERQADGRVTQLGQFKPGDQQRFDFAAQSTAVFVNATIHPAELKIVVNNGDKNLTMKYVGKN